MPQSLKKLRKKGIGKPPPPPPQPKPHIKLRIKRRPLNDFNCFLEQLLQLKELRNTEEVVLEKKYLYELIDESYIKDKGELEVSVENFLTRHAILVRYDGKLVRFNFF